MANQEHLKILKRGVKAWNRLRPQPPGARPDLERADLHGANLHAADLNYSSLYEADLSGADLKGADLLDADLGSANLSGANLSGANLSMAKLRFGDFSDADLSGASLSGADLLYADLSGANLSDAILYEANLNGANLSMANLSGANLRRATLVGTDLSNATLTGCSVFGISAWKLELAGTVQRNLDISEEGEPTITVDNLEVAQFIYLMLNNQRIRAVIDSITSKAVLILGRFTEERKVVLDAMREELRKRDYLPILFDFEQPTSRNLTETVSTLAHMARFVIADVTDAKSIPQELQRIVPDLPSLPVQPLILASHYEYGMFKDFQDYPWVLKPFRYKSLADLLSSLEIKVIGPAAAKAKEIEDRRKAFEQMPQ